jgi:hypothetical protein
MEQVRWLLPPPPYLDGIIRILVGLYTAVAAVNVLPAGARVTQASLSSRAHTIKALGCGVSSQSRALSTLCAEWRLRMEVAEVRGNV